MGGQRWQLDVTTGKQFRQTLIAVLPVRVGIVSRNVTQDPATTLDIVCRDDITDHMEARAAEMGALIAPYGFEEHSRLLERYDVPAEIIAHSPESLAAQLCHTPERPSPEVVQGFISA